jgi:chemotaxis protein CheD
MSRRPILSARPAPVSGALLPACVPTASAIECVKVGIGELAVSSAPGTMIITPAIGSCIAVILHDPQVPVAALLHFLLPESRIDPERAAQQPAAFADTGIPLLLEQVRQRGMDPRCTRVWLIGGAEVMGGGTLSVGKRNTLAARNILWKHGLLVHEEAVGGTDARMASVTVIEGLVGTSTAGHVTTPRERP